MGIPSAYGMGPRGFKVNRPLNNYEQTQHFNIKHSASDDVHYDGSITKFNNTYVEYVDKWYGMRGAQAFAGVVFSSVILFGVGSTLYSLFAHDDIWSLIFVILFLLILIVPVKFMLLLDAFQYTHYPIRFNRKNRKVYVFRWNGTIFKAGWDELYWTIYDTAALGSGFGSLNLMGHVLDKDGVTVKESIGLGPVDSGEGGRQNLLQFFEFIRRYMEQGPGPTIKALEPTPLIMLPDIDQKRESWFFGWMYLTGSVEGRPVLKILGQVFFFPESLFRWIVMHTSKIPQWPQWVEDECAIAPGDPWARDGQHQV